MADNGGTEHGGYLDHEDDNTVQQNRTLQRVVSADFATNATLRAATLAQIIAAAGVIVWGVVTYLEWHQLHKQGVPRADQVLGALQPFGILLFSAILGIVGTGCRLAGNWISIRLSIDYLEDTGDDDDE